MEVVSDAGSTDQQWVSRDWRIVNDDVMVAILSAHGQLKMTKRCFRRGRFVRNNGGFASVRSPLKNALFKDADGVKIRLVGDQNIYRLCLRSASPMGISYQADIAHPVGPRMSFYRSRLSKPDGEVVRFLRRHNCKRKMSSGLDF